MQSIKSFCFFNVFLLTLSLRTSDQALNPIDQSNIFEYMPKDAQKLALKDNMLQQEIFQYFEQELNKSVPEFIGKVTYKRYDFGYKTAVTQNGAIQHRILVYNNINARYNNTPYNPLVLAINIGNNTQTVMLSDGKKNLKTKTLTVIYSFDNVQFLEGQERLVNKSKFTTDDQKLYALGETILKNEFDVTFLSPVPWYKRYFNKFLLAIGLGALCVGAYCYVKSPQNK